ncbi:uncharacterized protein LOC119360544 [Triticum dicoccoides]|uniref:uncharacterized protein LOC119360544 n=1 Tax=Triticum dicoccoides TaxID=85692 RepID=UPI00188E8A18|nr:uncharacterized protein LOC119360544 [Triticum dicoccoides]
MSTCSGFTGSKPGSGFGRTRRGERLAGAVAGGEGSLMARVPLRARRPSGVTLRLGPGGAEGRRARARRRGRPRLHSPQHPGTAATAREGRPRRVLQPRHVAGLDVVEDGVEGAAGDAPPLAPSFGVEAAAGNGAVDGGDLLLAAALELQHPQRFAVGRVSRLVPLLLRQGGADTGDLRPPCRPFGYRQHRDAAGAQSPRPRHAHVRGLRVLGLAEKARLRLLEVSVAEAVHRCAVAWEPLGHALLVRGRRVGWEAVLRVLLRLLQRVGDPLQHLRVRLPRPGGAYDDLQHDGAGAAPAAARAADAVRVAGQGDAQVVSRRGAGRAAEPDAMRRQLRGERELARGYGRDRRVERAGDAVQLGGGRGHAGLVRHRRHGRQGVRRVRAGLLLQRHRRRGRRHLHAGQGRLRAPAQGEQRERRGLPRAREAAVRALLHQKEWPRRRRRGWRRRVPDQGLLQRRGVRHAADDSEPGGWHSREPSWSSPDLATLLLLLLLEFWSLHFT